MKLASLLAVAALTSLLPLSAAAQSLSPADAQRRNEQGAAAFGKGDFVSAADAFADVYRATGETKHLWNLALAESQAGRPFDALTHLRLYVTKSDATPKNLERARTIMNDLTDQIGRLAAQIAHVTVVAPKGADVLLDGTPIGAAPLSTTLDVDPAKPHVIVAQRGSDTTKQNLAPTGESTMRVELVFPVAPAPAPQAAPAPPPVAPAVAPATEPAPASPAPHGGSSARTWVTVGLGVAAVGALGAGVAMVVGSNNSANSAHGLIAGLPQNACANPTPAQASSCSQIASDRSTQSTDATASVVLYAGAGVLAAGALAAFLFMPHGHGAEKSGAIVPLVAPGVAGVGYTGAF